MANNFKTYVDRNNVYIRDTIQNNEYTVVLTPRQAFEVACTGCNNVVLEVRITCIYHDEKVVAYDEMIIGDDGVIVIPSASMVLTAPQTDMVYDNCVALIKKLVKNW